MIKDDHSFVTNMTSALQQISDSFQDLFSKSRCTGGQVAHAYALMFESMARDQISFSGLIGHSQQQLPDPTIFHFCSLEFAVAVCQHMVVDDKLVLKQI